VSPKVWSAFVFRAAIKGADCICFPGRREADPWRLRTKLPVLYAPENKHQSAYGAHVDAWDL
jgi:hypothetical protein